MTEADNQKTHNNNNINNNNTRRLCDYCNSKTALLYCRPDTAKLCLTCDKEVHSTNPLFSKHTRFLLCDTCHSSPATLLCETERFLLCHNCDWECHSIDGSHQRRPVEGFSGCPSGTELGALLGFDNVGWLKEDNGWVFGSGLDDEEGLLVWESLPVVGLEDFIDSGSGLGLGLSFRALDVPPLPKNRNAVCGQYKEEMLYQLRALTKLDSGLNSTNPDVEPIKVYESLAVRHDLEPQATAIESDVQPCSLSEENVFQLLSDPAEAGNLNFLPTTLLKSDFEESSVVPDKQFNIGGSIIYEQDGIETQSQHHFPSKALPALPKAPSHEFKSQERDSAISRYKEKRKIRRYNKHIRYESRKVRAESRTRIRGRFAKIDR